VQSAGIAQHQGADPARVPGCVADRRRAADRATEQGDGFAARARLPLAEAEEAAGDPPAAPPEDDAFGLTARERQVLALVAEGATNRQIGARLYMAEKTASVHVSRILAKLGVRSRTEAAGVAHRSRLVDADGDA
jgi:DNA-binding NarL/FixJ family response regulator